MESLNEILESELREAVEVRNEKSLHRYIVLLTENLAGRRQSENGFNTLRSDIAEMLLFMRERFEAVDKRFESVDKRFEAVDKRFEAVDKRFESVDKRFEDMQKQMDKRFEAVDKRFDDVNRRFTMMFSFITVGFVVLATLMSLYQFIG